MVRPAPATSAFVRLLHYWWPLLLGWSLTIVVYRATGRPADPYGLALFLCGIVAVYSLDRVLDSPDCEDASWIRPVLWVSGTAASVGCAWLLFQIPVRIAVLAPVMALTALAYPAVKRPPLSKTLVVAVVWTWAAIALPFHDQSWFGWRWILVPVSIPLLLLMASGCLLCDLSDITADRASRVLTVPVLLGVETAVRIAVALAALGAVSALGLHRPGLAVGGLGLAALGFFPSLLARDNIGPLIVDVALTLPGVLIVARVV